MLCFAFGSAQYRLPTLQRKRLKDCGKCNEMRSGFIYLHIFPLLVTIFHLSFIFHSFKMKASSLFGIIISFVVSASAAPQGIQQNNRADNADVDPQISTSWRKFKYFYLVNLHHHQLLTRRLSRRDLQTMAKVRLRGISKFQILTRASSRCPHTG
jgi:hypothetical protein